MSPFASELHHIPDEEHQSLAATVARFDERMNYLGDVPETPDTPHSFRDWFFDRWLFGKPWAL